jgi:hypothetical protein
MSGAFGSKLEVREDEMLCRPSLAAMRRDLAPLGLAFVLDPHPSCGPPTPPAPR